MFFQRVLLFTVVFFNSGVLAQASPIFGDDTSMWSKDGVCDDPRFEGPGMTTAGTSSENIGHDASDCAFAWENGQLWLQGTKFQMQPSSRPLISETAPEPPLLGYEGNNDISFAELVSFVQLGLNELGYLDGFSAGIVDIDTKRAIEAFQADFDFDITGEPDAAMLAAVFAMVGLDYRSASNFKATRPTGNSGSAFFVSSVGHAVTNEHVVAGCSTLVTSSGERVLTLATDEFLDLAIIKVDTPKKQNPFLSLRQSDELRLAEPVLAIGFPLSGLLDNGVNATIGNVTALAGPGSDFNLFQMSAPIQSGSSGGPVLDGKGALIGVVVSKLDALLVAEEIGDIPQNVNFAINLSALKTFFARNNFSAYTISESSNSVLFDELAFDARKSVFRIVCN